MSKKSQKLNFYASFGHFFDHIVPIYQSLPKKYRGKFFIEERVVEKAKINNIEYTIGKPEDGLTLVASFGDYGRTSGDVVFMEHGIGHTYSNDHPSFAGGRGKDRTVLFLNQHHITQEKNMLKYPNAKHEIIGTPKMDSVSKVKSKQSVVCLSFHWDNRISPESRSAFDFYKRIIPILLTQKDFRLVFHGHPRTDWTKMFKGEKIEFITDLKEVFELADVYVCDNSSSMYEFLLTGKPVIYLNCPYYRKSVRHGIRFWTHIAGQQVDQPFKLLEHIRNALKFPELYSELREEVVKELYPYYPNATQRAKEVLKQFMESYNEAET